MVGGFVWAGATLHPSQQCRRWQRLRGKCGVEHGPKGGRACASSWLLRRQRDGHSHVTLCKPLCTLGWARHSSRHTEHHQTSLARHMRHEMFVYLAQFGIRINKFCRRLWVEIQRGSMQMQVRKGKQITLRNGVDDFVGRPIDNADRSSGEVLELGTGEVGGVN